MGKNWHKEIRASLELKLKEFSAARYGIENASFYLKREFFLSPIRSRLKHELKCMMNSYMIRYKYKREFDRFLGLLDSTSRELLLELLAYRILGFRRVKLSVNRPSYWKQLSKLQMMAKETVGDAVSTFSGLKRFDLAELGYNLKIDYTADGIMMDFLLEQYAYKNSTTIQADQGDVVLDIGGCWGDTALYFAEKVGPRGQVYSFEFIPRNIRAFRWNVGLNPHLSERITLVESPVFSSSGVKVFYQDKGQGSKVKMRPFRNMTGETETLSIDDFVRSKEIKVDFIKMDIEGAEMLALEGARETILKFKPKLAIAIYHSIGDMARIPNWIADLNLGYKIHLGHYTIHEDETVCFAGI